MKYIDVNKPVVDLYNKGIGVCEIGKRLGVSRNKVLRIILLLKEKQDLIKTFSI